MILTRKTTTKLNMLRKTSNSPSQQLLFLRTTTYDYFITIIISNITISNITIFTIFIFFVITNTNVVIFIIILSTVDVSTIKFSNFCYLFIYLFIYFILFCLSRVSWCFMLCGCGLDNLIDYLPSHIPIYELYSIPNVFRDWSLLCKSYKKYINFWTQHWIPHIGVSLGTKFCFKQTILSFGNKISQIQYFQWKIEKESIVNQLCIFELVWVKNPSLNLQFWLFGPNLLEKGIPV